MSQSTLYDELIMDHIRNARNYRELPDAQRRAQSINPLCGDVLTVYLELSDERIAQASFQCECCGIAMASASVMTQSVQGRTVAEASELARRFIALTRRPQGDEEAQDTEWRALLSVVRASPSRANCARLGWLTLEAALEGRAALTL
jgi:nitrogen fixation NifU-like protein